MRLADVRRVDACSSRVHLLTISQAGIHLSDNELIAYNSTYLIFQTELVLGVFGMLPALVFVVNAATRDHAQSTAELVYTTPVGRLSFLLGRFAGATLCTLIVGLGGSAGHAGWGVHAMARTESRRAVFPAAVCGLLRDARRAEPARLLRARLLCGGADSHRGAEFCDLAGADRAGARDQHARRVGCAGLALLARPLRWSWQ